MKNKLTKALETFKKAEGDIMSPVQSSKLLDILNEKGVTAVLQGVIVFVEDKLIGAAEDDMNAPELKKLVKELEDAVEISEEIYK